MQSRRQIEIPIRHKDPVEVSCVFLDDREIGLRQGGRAEFTIVWTRIARVELQPRFAGVSRLILRDAQSKVLGTIPYGYAKLTFELPDCLDRFLPEQAKPSWLRPSESAHLPLALIATGIPAGGPQRFVYRKRFREADLRKEARSTWVFPALFMLLPLVGLGTCALTIGENPILASLLVIAGLAVFLHTWRSQSQEIDARWDLRPGFQDEIEVENLAVWVIRDGRRIPARIVDSVYQESPARSIFRHQFRLAVADEEICYDASLMVDPEVADISPFR